MSLIPIPLFSLRFTKATSNSLLIIGGPLISSSTDSYPLDMSDPIKTIKLSKLLHK